MSTTIIGQFSVSFNRERNTWTVARTSAGPGDQSVAEFGTGTIAYWKAIRLAVEYQYPELADLVLRLRDKWQDPDLSKRGWRAAQLLIADKVLTPAPGQEAIAVVGSQSGPQQYVIGGQERPGQPLVLTCTCPDFRENGAPVVAGHKLCKHVLAVRMRVAVGWLPRLHPKLKKQLILYFASGDPVPHMLGDMHAEFVVQNLRSADDEEELRRWWLGNRQPARFPVEAQATTGQEVAA